MCCTGTDGLRAPYKAGQRLALAKAIKTTTKTPYLPSTCPR